MCTESTTILRISRRSIENTQTQDFGGIKIPVPDGLVVDYDGKLITEKQYGTRIVECIDMKIHEGLDPKIDCPTWVITEEGAKGIIEYGLKKYYFN